MVQMVRLLMETVMKVVEANPTVTVKTLVTPIVETPVQIVEVEQAVAVHHQTIMVMV
jgi:hypothetical protein